MLLGRFCICQFTVVLYVLSPFTINLKLSRLFQRILRLFLKITFGFEYLYDKFRMRLLFSILKLNLVATADREQWRSHTLHYKSVF